MEYGGGAVVLRMDHTSMTGLRFEDGGLVEHAGYAGTLSRKDAHYLGLYRSLLGDGPDDRLGVPLARTIATTLEAAEALTEAETKVAFSDLCVDE